MKFYVVYSKNGTALTVVRMSGEDQETFTLAHQKGFVFRDEAIKCARGIGAKDGLEIFL